MFSDIDQASINRMYSVRPGQGRTLCPCLLCQAPVSRGGPLQHAPSGRNIMDQRPDVFLIQEAATVTLSPSQRDRDLLTTIT
jgi:hypothetical protein